MISLAMAEHGVLRMQSCRIASCMSDGERMQWSRRSSWVQEHWFWRFVAKRYHNEACAFCLSTMKLDWMVCCQIDVDARCKRGTVAAKKMAGT
jgi:hypothetical protein